MSTNKTRMTLAVGTAFTAAALLSSQAALAGGNPFTYVGDIPVIASNNTGTAESKCGGEKGTEGKCGAEKGSEGKCGAEKGSEGKCGASK